MKTLIKNGIVIDPKNGINKKAGVLIENNKVAAILNTSEKVEADELIDAKGSVIAPGFVDLHTHLREPGFEYKETIESGTQSAAAGGFTSICCMANTNPVNDKASVTESIIKKAQALNSVNVFPIGALTKNLEGKELSSMGELKKAGCIAVSDDGKAVRNTHIMRLAMEYAKSFGLPVITHSIDPDLAERGVMNEGIVSTRLGLSGIPHEAEDICIARDIYLAKLTKAQLHVAHVATKEGVALIRRAKEDGLRVSAEVCPHHFTLTDEAVKDYDTNAKMAPPLREAEDIEALIEALSDGTIDAIATDHAPHAQIDKETEFDCACFGIVGLESALNLSLELVHQKRLSLEQMIASLTYKAADIVGLKKGDLSVGSDADIVIFNPDTETTIDPQKFFSKSKNSPFAGRQTKGIVHTTIVGGRLIYKKD